MRRSGAINTAASRSTHSARRAMRLWPCEILKSIAATANMAANAATANAANSGEEMMLNVVIGVLAQTAIMENHLTCARAGSDMTIPAISNNNLCFIGFRLKPVLGTSFQLPLRVQRHSRGNAVRLSENVLAVTVPVTSRAACQQNQGTREDLRRDWGNCPGGKFPDVEGCLYKLGAALPEAGDVLSAQH